MRNQFPRLSLIGLAVISACAYAAEDTAALDVINVNAENAAAQSRQSFDTSVISAKEIAKQPVVNDISEVVAKQPGVILSSGSSTGAFGNKRQINIRGMGPDNTLILIDGKPVTSRNSARWTRRGGSNTFGDSHWVPVEEISSIEVLRGAAATRYGSGAMGGVVNIKTQPVTDKLRGSLSYYLNVPEDSKFGTTNRASFNLSGPIIQDVLGFRLYGSWSKTREDALDANPPIVSVGRNGQPNTTYYAAREGQREKDIAGRLAWKINPQQTLTLDASYSRHGNIYSGGDTDSADIDEATFPLQGSETNRVYRQAYSLTHEGKWSWGENKTYFQFDKTVNSRFPVGLGYSAEGSWADYSFIDSTLKNYRIDNELLIPLKTGAVDHLVTVGMDWNYSHLNDPQSMSYDFVNNGFFNLGSIPWLAQGNRSGKTSAVAYGVFVEDKIAVGATTITPMVRFDHHSVSGSNWSPSLNITHDVNDYLSISGGLSRAYKAPNLYQSTPNYVLANRQNMCPVNGLAMADVGSCYTVGNADLKPETSFNKELGFELHNKQGYKLGLTYFHNAYHNKIEADTNVLAQIYNPEWRRARVAQSAGTRIYKWDNIPRAVVEGFEGYLNLPLVEDKLSLNTNFTYMRKSVNKTTGNPLSLNPKYTISSTLSYQINDNLDFATTYTRYGKQLSRPNAVYYMEFSRNGDNNMVQERLGSYGVWGASIGYQWKNFSVRAGVSNILNKRIYVTNSNASKSNEIGRAYYTTLKYSF